MSELASEVVAPASESAPWGGPGWGPTVPPVTEESLHDGRALHDLLAELRSRQSHPDEGLIARAPAG